VTSEIIASNDDSVKDISVIITDVSKINNYDFVALMGKNNEKTRKIIFEDDSGSGCNFGIFSFNINYFESINKKIKRLILIKGSYIYTLKADNLEISKRFCMNHLDKITVSKKSPNLIGFHFKEGDDLLIEILKRSELLYFLRDYFVYKKKALKMKISEDFNINLNKKTCHIIMSRLSKEFITLNFDNAQKLGYLEKLSNGFFGKRFVEKFLVLTDIGLLYFDDPNEKQPKRIIPILGSDFKIVDCKDYKKEFLF